MPKNDAESVTWLRRAALQGNAEAEYQLGRAYAEGRGVKRDPEQALGWWLRASRRGHPQAIAMVRRIESGAAAKAGKADK